ncbi:putative lipoprotein [Cystobacter fuscus DSM 2262]|uniref:Lipoprotein n=1 Tax=Cystobacter fuscus (strain ATCC 25194 / DSM 2262 / NBRC 100088 / M29) TaxID=1242864 RepID=S9PI68_CYSF2|nr:putative lipoprotein [Cystobacter fuscus DSM 2262]
MWREGMGLFLLAFGMGCGGPLPDEGEESATREVSSALLCLPDEASTQRVRTIFPPTEYPPRLASFPESLEEFRGQLYFAANFDDGRRALWKSDGTEAGTVLVKEFPVTEAHMTPSVRELTASPSLLFFQAADAEHGSELWVSDGTSGGTRLLKDLTPGVEGSSLSQLTALESRLVFFRNVYDPASSSSRGELWTSDGTEAGTVPVRDFPEGAEVSNAAGRLGGALLFFVRDASGTALWSTDGTVGGTARLTRLDAGPDSAYASELRISGGLAFFSLAEPTGDTEVWRTDGTAAGTVRLKTYGPTRGVRLLDVLGSYLYLTTTSYSTQYMVLNRLPVAGGDSTSIFTFPNPYASQGEAFPYVTDVSVAPQGTKIFFSFYIGSSGPAPRDTQLWVTDGTASGTTLLRRPLSLSDEYGSPVHAVSDELVFFSAFEQESAGIEPWVSNGTPGGTRRLEDVRSGGDSSYPREFLRVGDRVFFSAFDETQANQLWSTTLRDACVAPVRE